MRSTSEKKINIEEAEAGVLFNGRVLLSLTAPGYAEGESLARNYEKKLPLIHTKLAVSQPQTKKSKGSHSNGE